MTARYLRAAAIAVVFAALIPSSAMAQQATARAVIEQFHYSLVEMMKSGPNLGFSGRRERLSPAVNGSFDLAFMAKYTAGGAWDKMTPDQQNRLVAAFAEFTLANYASRFKKFSGQRFEVVSEIESKAKDTLVRTELVKSDGEKIGIDYLLRNGTGGWRIIDIFVKRISELATRKSEYVSIIQRDGVEALITSIGTKAKDIANDSG